MSATSGSSTARPEEAIADRGDQVDIFAVGMVTPGAIPAVRRRRSRDLRKVKGSKGRMELTGRGGVNRVQFKVAARRVAMDISWMTNDELSEAIPPAYTEFIGRSLIAALERAAA